MRRIALLGLTLLLPACQTMVGNPLDGAGGFIADTHTFHLNPNRPVGNAPNVLRVEGRQVNQAPLTTEPGDVWPGPIAPEPTLQDIERQQNQAVLNGQPTPLPRRGAAAPSPAQPAVPTPTYPTQQGPAIGTPGANGVQTYTSPTGGTGIVVPNGNGTSTLIGPNGVTGAPTPR